jgi:membrane protease YdiL (CAAX protease family)
MKPDKPFPNAGLAALLTAGVVGLQMMLAFAMELAAAVYAVVAQQPPAHPMRHPAALGLVNLAAFGAVLSLGIGLAGIPLREVFAFRRVRPILLLPVLFGTAGAAVVLSEADNLFRWLFPVPDFLVAVFRDLFSTDTGWLGATFALVVVAPLTEEVFFRGLILRGLLGRQRLRVALLISATLFALAHLNPWQFVSAAVLGVLFGWWYYRTRSNWPGLLGHALVNGAVLASGCLPVEIPGFNAVNPSEPVVFQRVWFDAMGLVLLGLGIWLFHRWSPPPPRFSRATDAAGVPPVLPPAQAGS